MVNTTQSKLSSKETAKLCAEYFLCGFKDAFAWPSSLITIYGYILFKSKATLFTSSNQRNDDDGIYAPFLTDTIVALTYQLFWVYPIFLLSFVLNAMWYQEIADHAYQIHHGNPVNSQWTYNRALGLIAAEIYRAVLFMNYLFFATTIYILPIVGPIISFIFFCWIYAYYSFEYKWINRGWKLEQRIQYFEEKWAYFAGFGFTFTVLTFFIDQFLSAGVFALFFPLYIIMANNARPMPRQDERARFSSSIPYRLPVFWVARKLNDKLITCFS
ncbi:10982_t:CDS:2 [Funneliformis mosseae]|uniref:10982_t:CDS:1 n=1 Tax=Funneliformis mosseae TaxID=27381 RepID=A0A9N9CVL5_FUNMO|nr:10982_t:CDS:2 [Funneliformis mosseae]